MKPVSVLLLVLGAMLAGVAHAGDSLEPRKAYRKADQAFARAAVLQRSDLPGWRVQAVEGTGTNDLRCGRVYAPNLSDLTVTGQAQSSFAQGVSSFALSGAGLFASAAQAAKAWKRVITPGLVKCLRMSFEASVRNSSSGLEVRTLYAGPLALPRVAERTAAFRLSVEVKVNGQAVRSYFDVVLLGRGRISAELGFVSLQRPFPPAFERELARSVASRMRGR